MLPFATDIRDNVRPRSSVGSVKTAQSYCGNEKKIPQQQMLLITKYNYTINLIKKKSFKNESKIENC